MGSVALIMVLHTDGCAIGTKVVGRGYAGQIQTRPRENWSKMPELYLVIAKHGSRMPVKNQSMFDVQMTDL